MGAKPQKNQENSAGKDAQSDTPAETSCDDSVLSDAATQALYRQEYLEQLKRRACPGCGEDFSDF